MASTMTKRGQADNVVTYEFVCDSAADLQKIEPQYITLGSIATVISGETGFEVYMANSQKQWISLGGGSGNSGSSEPVWVNQDIITSVPNMSLNNHIIQGNIIPEYTNSNPLFGWLAVNINPSLTTSFIDTYHTQPAPDQEYYIACCSEPASAYGILDNIIDTLITPVFIQDISTTEEIDVDIAFEISSIADTLYIYKIPGYIYENLYNNSNPLLTSYLFSSLQPEATYDVSQLTYETPQAGE